LLLAATSGSLEAALDSVLQGPGVQFIGPGDALPKEAPRLIIADLQHASNLELPLITASRVRFPRSPIVAVFRAARRADAAKALLAGADATLPAPFGLDEFAAWIRSHDMRGRATPNQAASNDTSPAARVDLDSLTWLVRSVAHEVNNPLTTIRGFLQLLGTQGKSGLSKEDRQDAYSTMQEQANRIAEIVKELDHFAGQKPPSRSKVDLEGILNASLRAHGLMNVVSKAHGPTIVVGDQQQLETAVDHMVGYLADSDTDESQEHEPIEASLVGGDDAVTLTLAGHVDTASEPDPVRLLRPLMSRAREHSLARVLGIARAHGGSLHAQHQGRNRLSLAFRLPTARA